MVDDFASRIDPGILASVLREVEGVELDPSTESGAVAAAQVVRRLMQDEAKLEQMILVLLRLEEAAAGGPIVVPEVFGPVVTLPGDPME